jgi:hypothetical protein
VLVSDNTTGETYLLDVTTPVAHTLACLRAWLAGGAIDAHILHAVREKMNYYADKPAAMLFCACVLGSFGEVNTEFFNLMGWLSRKAAEKKCSSADPAARKRFASAFKYRLRLRLSFTLARGKALQFQLARERLPLAARGAAAAPAVSLPNTLD